MGLDTIRSIVGKTAKRVARQATPAPAPAPAPAKKEKTPAPKSDSVSLSPAAKAELAGQAKGAAEPELSPANIEKRSRLANATGNPQALDSVDSFRSSLPAEQQEVYDQQLEELRQDDRIHFVEHEGAEADLATRDFALRGILTATFGNPEDLEKALNTAAHNGHNEAGELVERDGDGQLDIHLYPDQFPLDPLKNPNGQKISGGLVTSGGDIHASKAFLGTTLANGENLFTHEFTHVTQGSRADGSWQPGNAFPEDFPPELAERFEHEFKSPEFQQYFEEVGFNREYSIESYPGAQTVFRYYPEDLAEASPELYDIMSAYNGYDPLAGEQVERQVRSQGGGGFFGGVLDALNPFN